MGLKKLFIFCLLTIFTIIEDSAFAQVCLNEVGDEIEVTTGLQGRIFALKKGSGEVYKGKGFSGPDGIGSWPKSTREFYLYQLIEMDTNFNAYYDAIIIGASGFLGWPGNTKEVVILKWYSGDEDLTVIDRFKCNN